MQRPVSGRADPGAHDAHPVPARAGPADTEPARACRLLATSFETFERQIRDQLGRTLGPGGFDPARDITAITVNRWPHGYAYEYNPLFDPDWDEHNRRM